MGHDRIYCYDFHGTPFRNVPGLQLSAAKLPDSEFYARLYEQVTPDEQFIDGKRMTGQMFARILSDHTRPGTMLSWGAGTGLVEGELAKAGWHIDAVEPGASDHWPEGVNRARHIDELTGSYDVVMTVSTLYSQTDAECAELLRKFAERVRSRGFLLLAEQDTRSIAGALYGALAARFKHRPERGAQFWGYLRGPSWYRRKMPLQHVWSRYYGLNPDWSYRQLGSQVRLLDRQLFRRRSKMQLHLFQKIG